MSCKRCVTLPLSCPLHFEHQVESRLVPDDPLLIGKRQVFPDEAQVKAGGFGDLTGCEAGSH